MAVSTSNFSVAIDIIDMNQMNQIHFMERKQSQQKPTNVASCYKQVEM